MEQKNIEGKTDEARSCAAPGSPFVRERRYLVVKLNDAKKHLTPHDFNALEFLVEKVDFARRSDAKEPMECVVVESDWPEYAPTWALIEKRMTENHGVTPTTAGYQSPAPENRQGDGALH